MFVRKPEGRKEGETGLEDVLMGRAVFVDIVVKGERIFKYTRLLLFDGFSSYDSLSLFDVFGTNAIISCHFPFLPLSPFFLSLPSLSPPSPSRQNNPIGPSSSECIGEEEIVVQDPEKAYEILSSTKTPGVPSGKK